MEFVLLFVLVIVWARLLRANYDLRETRWKLRRARREETNGDEHP